MAPPKARASSPAISSRSVARAMKSGRRRSSMQTSGMGQLAAVQLNDDGKVEMCRPKTTRIELEDDTSEADLRSFLAALHEVARENAIDTFVIKTRAKKGRMAGGAVSFKIETLIQLVQGCHTRFVSPVALAHFAKKEVGEYPKKLPVYLKNAFLSGAHALTRG